MKLIAKSKRLNIRELNEFDAQFILELTNSAGWIRYIGARNISTIAEGLDYIKSGPEKSYQENGFGLWAVVKNKGNDTMGLCGIIKLNPLSQPDIGFAFLPKYEGKGYAYEAARLCIGIAFDKYRLDQLKGIVMPNNMRSIQLLQRLGMSYRDTDHQQNLDTYVLINNTVAI